MRSSMHIVFDPLFPAWVLIAIALAVIALTAVSFRSSWKNACLRLVVAGLLMSILAQPKLAEETRRPLKSIVLVASDESRSQDFVERRALLKTAKDRLDFLLAKMPDIEVRKISVARDAKDETRIADEITAALADIPPVRRAGTIVLTDGQVTDANPTLFGDAPFHAILTGSRKDRDRAVSITTAPRYGLEGRDLTLRMTVTDNPQTPGTTAALTLTGPDGRTETRTVPTGQPVEWPVRLSTAGSNLFEFSTPVLPGELSPGNNSAVVDIRAVRDRLRVLLISGVPYPGARMWRDLLKSDPGIDLVHFTILRGPETFDAAPPSDMSLIAFPFEELFERKLDNFDLVIMDGFGLTSLLPDYYFQNLRGYVEQGGAMLEIDGPDFAEANSLFYTSLGDVLPNAPDGEILDGAYRPALTDNGKTHPVTAPLNGKTYGRWLQQQPVRNRFGEVVMQGHGSRPLLTLAHVRNGRIAQLSSQDIWLWARGYDGGGPVNELVRRSVHWLMKEPELDEEALFATTAGDEISLRLRSRQTPLQLNVVTPRGTESSVDLQPGDKGWLTGRIRATENGVYRIGHGKNRKLVVVGDMTTPEFRDIVTTDKQLRDSAEKNGGGIVWAEDFSAFTLRGVTRGRVFHGHDWLGLKTGEASDLIASKLRPVLPAGWALLLVLAAACLLWWTEGRPPGNPSSPAAKP